MGKRLFALRNPAAGIAFGSRKLDLPVYNGAIEIIARIIELKADTNW
jgi:hypothetical protein